MQNVNRDDEIIKLLEDSPSQVLTVEFLASHFNTSQSTIRRDLSRLSSQHKIKRTHGGASSLAYSSEMSFERFDREYFDREQTEPETKKAIARRASQFIKDNMCIYLDASTTVAAMIEFLPQHKGTCYVTNSPLLASKLTERGLHCFVAGGELKLTTNAFIGAYTVEFLNMFNFNIGFFGTNGIHPQAYLTTPDPQECAIKKAAFERCSNCYILADHTKFDKISTATFADFARPVVITDSLPDKYKAIIKHMIVEK